MWMVVSVIHYLCVCILVYPWSRSSSPMLIPFCLSTSNSCWNTFLTRLMTGENNRLTSSLLVFFSVFVSYNFFSSKTGVFTLAACSARTFPSLSSPESPTFEHIHPSVLERMKLPPPIKHLIENNPNIVCKLQPFELSVREYWHKHSKQDKAKAMAQDAYRPRHRFSFEKLAKILLRINSKLSHLLTKRRKKIA